MEEAMPKSKFKRPAKVISYVPFCPLLHEAHNNDYHDKEVRKAKHKTATVMAILLVVFLVASALAHWGNV